MIPNTINSCKSLRKVRSEIVKLEPANICVELTLSVINKNVRIIHYLSFRRCINSADTRSSMPFALKHTTNAFSFAINLGTFFPSYRLA